MCFYDCTMIISAEAATINMTKVPQLSVKEGSVVAFMCETGFAYPNPPAVRWFVDDVPIDRKGGYTEENNQLFGNYNIQMTKSTLNFSTKREMNDKEVKCVLVNDDTKLIKHSLNVMCKYLVVPVYKSNTYSYLYQHPYILSCRDQNYFMKSIPGKLCVLQLITLIGNNTQRMHPSTKTHNNKKMKKS